MTEWIAAVDAAQVLGVKRATLYSYVSRGLLTPRRSHGRSLFARSEVEAVLRERSTPGLLAMRAVRSSVSAVREGELFLRGRPLAELADEPFGDVVDLVLDGGRAAAPVDDVSVPDHLGRLPLSRRMAALAQWTAATAPPLSEAGQVRGAVRGLLRVAPAALGGRVVTGEPLPASLFAALAGRDGSREEVAVLNTVLVSLVDHGLAASVVAARVAGSARSSVYDCLVAGYAALHGPLHGGAATAALRTLEPPVEPAGHTAAPLPAPASTPGFRHWRHPGGDPRAEVILARLARVDGADVVLRRLDAHAERLGAPVNVDGALAALVVTSGLDRAAGEVCFQVARTVGMGAHLVEELAERPLRWRARDPEL